jgi:hypothetical protein
MPIVVEKLPNEPILILTYSGDVQAADMVAVQGTSLALTEGSQGPVYRINNTLPLNLTFGMMIAILGEAAAARPGSGRDGRFVDLAVVNTELARLGVTALGQEQYGHLNIPIFGDLDSALKYAREQS